MNHFLIPSLVWVLTSLIGSASLRAQPLSGRPANAAVSLTVDGAATGRTEFAARGASAGGIAVVQAGFKLSVPLPPLDSRWFPTAGLEYRHYELDRSAATPLPDTLQTVGASFTLVGRLDSAWTVIGGISPRLAQSGNGFSNRGAGFGALAIASRQFSPGFSAGVGVVYDSLAKGTGRVLPVATFDWQPAPSWRVFLGFPRTGASWQWREDLKAEFVAEADFGSFYVDDDPLPPAAGRTALNRTRLEYQAVRVGPALTWGISPALEARFAAGAVPVLNADYHRRHYKLKAENTAMFTSLGLVWRF